MESWMQRITTSEDVAKRIIEEKKRLFTKHHPFTEDFQTYRHMHGIGYESDNGQHNRKQWVELNAKHAKVLLIQSGMDEESPNLKAHLEGVEHSTRHGAHYIDALLTVYGITDLDINTYKPIMPKQEQTDSRLEDVRREIELIRDGLYSKERLLQEYKANNDTIDYTLLNVKIQSIKSVLDRLEPIIAN